MALYLLVQGHFILQHYLYTTMNVLALLIIIVLLVTLFFLFKKRKKAQANRNTLLPEEWKTILKAEVKYYDQLSPEDKMLFEKRIQLFLSEKKITGVNVVIDDHTKVLVAASAVIPAFAFQGYNYPMIKEVLLYPASFDDSFLHPQKEMKQDRISGMVGSGPLSQVVMLSQPDLLNGFLHTNKYHNVGIHEFSHLLDKTDGVVDGVPENLLANTYVHPWLSEMHKEVQKIKQGTSDISPYALTNDAEFFAVASEYFFVSPTEFEKRHPELFSYLQKIFHQALSSDKVQRLD
ncbi:MAG: hypothetical protein JWO58_3006 [Chitinophagaceae bacterium]|nr:hypothetical protein [Chitinophagaceae bacterium]